MHTSKKEFHWIILILFKEKNQQIEHDIVNQLCDLLNILFDSSIVSRVWEKEYLYYDSHDYKSFEKYVSKKLNQNICCSYFNFTLIS